MILNAVKTRIFKAKENLEKFIIEHVPALEENSIVLITSKIVSLSQNQLVSKNTISRKDLVLREADEVLGETYMSYLTIKDGILIPTAGIDESNSESDDYILWPENTYGCARELWSSLKAHYKIKNLGIILTDSRCTPLRQGVSGIGIAHWGFQGVQNHIGKPDLFGRKMTVSTTNVVDCLASAAVLVMGESDESCPLAIATEIQGIHFQDVIDPKELFISKDKDIFKPLYV